MKGCYNLLPSMGVSVWKRIFCCVEGCLNCSSNKTRTFWIQTRIYRGPEELHCRSAFTCCDLNFNVEASYLKRHYIIHT